eukprot:6089202-Pleurochrysis_carterae.AAC.1
MSGKYMPTQASNAKKDAMSAGSAAALHANVAAAMADAATASMAATLSSAATLRFDSAEKSDEPIMQLTMKHEKTCERERRG